MPRTTIGDFNVLLSLLESSKYDGNRVVTQDMRNFHEYSAKIKVIDHIFSGPAYTWINNQDETFQDRKLERVLVNDQWLQCFSSYSVEFLVPGSLDHWSVKMIFENSISSPPKPFEMFIFLASHSEFLEVVPDS